MFALLIASAAPVAPPIGNVTTKPLIKIVSLAVKLQSTTPVIIPYLPPPLVNRYTAPSPAVSLNWKGAPTKTSDAYLLTATL